MSLHRIAIKQWHVAHKISLDDQSVFAKGIHNDDAKNCLIQHDPKSILNCYLYKAFSHIQSAQVALSVQAPMTWCSRGAAWKLTSHTKRSENFVGNASERGRGDAIQHA